VSSVSMMGELLFLCRLGDFFFLVWSCEGVAESFGEAPGKRALKKNNNKHMFCRLYQKQKYFLETFSCSLNIKKNLVLKVKKKQF
jgi:hypothetical protein